MVNNFGRSSAPPDFERAPGGFWARHCAAFCLCVCLIVVLIPSSGRADYVLLQNGLALFNVSVEDTASTGSRPLRVRFHPDSFQYDPRNQSVSALDGYAKGYWIADFVSTSTDVGKPAAKAFAYDHKWESYVTPARPVLVAPTPALTPIVTPVEKEAVIPENVISPTLPLDQRLLQQLQMFVEQQGNVAREVMTSETRGILSNEKGTEFKLKWLQMQRNILEKYYPTESEDVQKARKQWDEEIDSVKKTGKFSFE